MPKAYIDDSGRKDHSSVFVLAGFAAPVATWIPFLEDWQRVLDIPPSIEYFKSREAHHCTDQFLHFSKDRRDERVRLLCEVLDKHRPLHISCVVELEAFNKIIRLTSLPAWVYNPYYVAFWALLTYVARRQHTLGVAEPFNFVFDDQAEKKKVRDAWDEFVENAPSDVRPFIGMKPAFLDDREVKPLQAADLMAWQTREWNDAIRTKNLKRIFNMSLPWVKEDYRGLRFLLNEECLYALFKDALT